MPPAAPRDPLPDATLPLVLDPYGFIPKRCERHGRDLFRTRILLRPTICLTGREAAALVYDESRFRRRGVVPGWILKTLFGQGGVQGLDDEAHRHRKRMLVSLLAPERVRHLAAAVAEAWVGAARRWERLPQVVLYDELHGLLTRAVCAWAGVPLPERDVARRARELASLFEHAGSVGPGHRRARRDRKRTQRWIGGLVEQIRAGRLTVPRQSAVHVVATHRDLRGELLSVHEAAVEVLNVLRPTVAVSVYVTFLALALHEHPACRRRIEAGDGAYAEAVVQEVRRFYPFFPMIAARVRRDFEWRGTPFAAGTMVLLDLHGTNHDPRLWDEPEAFRPERFLGREPDAFAFIPQGGGDPLRHHRCPGEPATVHLMKVAARFLTTGMRYDVPPQDLRVDRSALPALPASRFVMRNVRLRE